MFGWGYLSRGQWVVVLGMAILHLWLAGRVDLTQDEAHYALFGYYLDWSYFDHPPMIGWLQALMLQLGDGERAMRLWAVLFQAFTAAALVALLRRVYPDATARAQWFVLAWYYALVMLQLMGMALLPDTPLQWFALLAAAALYRTLIEGDARYWLLVGLLFGLAGLSKYTAVTLVVSAVLLLLANRQWKQLLTPWPWLAVLIAALLISPVLWWNAQNDWISIEYQLNHGTQDGQWHWQDAAITTAVQLLVYTPVLPLFLLVYLKRQWRGWRQGWKQTDVFWLAMALPVLLLFAWSSGYEQVLPHWTAIGWLLLLPVLAKAMADRWPDERGWTLVGLGQASMTTAALLFLLSFPQLSTNLSNENPFHEIMGWPLATATAQRELERWAEETSDETPRYLFASNWSTASQLAWYARPTPVHLLKPKASQLALWYGAPTSGEEGVLVVPPKYAGKERQSGVRRFERCEEIDNTPYLGGYELFRCTGLTLGSS